MGSTPDSRPVDLETKTKNETKDDLRQGLDESYYDEDAALQPVGWRGL